MINSVDIIDNTSFVRESKKIYGKLFSYTDTNFIRIDKVISVKCKKHGLFELTPKQHLQGYPCPECNPSFYLKGTSKFLNKVKNVHCDKYNYSQTVYIHSKAKVKIECPEHGLFEQTPNKHLTSKEGCPECSIISRKEKLHPYLDPRIRHHPKKNKNPSPRIKLNSDSVKKELISKFGNNNVDYSKIKYVNLNTNMTFICDKHGLFERTLSSIRHSYNKGSKYLCSECNPKFFREKNLDIFLKKSKDKHGNKYNYSKVIYVNTDTKVEIICPEHGSFFQLPYRHENGSGCQHPECRKGAKHSYESYMKIVKEKNKGKYLFDKLTKDVFKGSSNQHYEVFCLNHNDYVKINSQSLLIGNKCPECNITGFDGDKPAILYYLSINNGAYYKIGITNKSVTERFRSADKHKFTILKEWYYEMGFEAEKKEKFILNEFKDYLVDKSLNLNVLVNGGNTELFNHDVLALDF